MSDQTSSPPPPKAEPPKTPPPTQAPKASTPSASGGFCLWTWLLTDADALHLAILTVLQFVFACVYFSRWMVQFSWVKQVCIDKGVKSLEGWEFRHYGMRVLAPITLLTNFLRALVISAMFASLKVTTHCQALDVAGLFLLAEIATTTCGMWAQRPWRLLVLNFLYTAGLWTISATTLLMLRQKKVALPF